MARRAKAKPPAEPPTPESVFDTAAPPPPQHYVKAVKRPPAPAVQPPAAPAGPAAGLRAAASGPWYTCGLGAGLLAQSPGLFALAVLLTYSFGTGLVMLLLWLLLRLCVADCGCECCDCGCDGCCDEGCCCDDCCDGSSGGSGGGNTTEGEDKDAPGFGVPAAAGGVLGALGLHQLRFTRPVSMAHHPDLPEFTADVFHWGGQRWCVGCFTVYPVFLVATSALLAMGQVVGWRWPLSFGLAMAAVQVVSSLGWARRRSVKVAVKASLGAGMALAFQGILWAPWPRAVQVAGLLGLLLAAAASTLPRRRRIQTALAARA